ncbi:MAG: MBL fold metallo-hydrolase [Bacteroidota bacterium]
MLIKMFTFNPFQVNTCILSDQSGNAIVIDPAMMDSSEQEEFRNFVESNNLQLKAMLFTHGHVDHIAGSAWVEREFGISPQGHRDDIPLLQTAEAHARSFGLEIEKPAELKHFLSHGDSLRTGNINLEIRHVPGHSPGGLAFIVHDEKIVFCGDSLFAGSIGRTDLPGGNYDQLILSVREQLLSLPDEYQLISGHGPASSIGHEAKNNPFFS